MAHLRINFVDVTCSATEDPMGSDTFYIAGAVTRSKGKAKGVLTSPIAITDGQTKTFSPDEAVVFDEDVSDGEIVTLVFHAYEEEVSKDWSGLRPKFLRQVQEKNGLDSENIQALLGSLVRMIDPDDRLGTLKVVIPVKGKPQENPVWKFAEKGLSVSSWDYAVNYRITRS
ncbi:hypothetical protein EPA93_28290 [Ktedonosporobacter rubrisoli]|uniref:Uncharacterized protein n=1 Tax=Ktedonosporobacter rubrisoli TaxID=2509675 RepID=A0A4P6JVI2_KTERU|nr:hypothetical protein [Ktedonosporobacter rubrisoli]QBD79667.1 hypothetical protein EPA93_28290 [Ktedonosporobacter rubrisoli]